jgi:uncharacterized membrane protein
MEDKNKKSDILEELGIDKNLINLIKPMIPQLISELLIKKSANFALEQKNITESINNNTKEKIEVLNQNIFSFRAILITITGFSLTIIGVVVSAVLSNQDIFKNQYLLYIGLSCFILNIFISILFILNIYHFENNKLAEQIRFNKDYLKEMNSLIHKHLKEGTFDTYLAEKQTLLEKASKEEEERANKVNKKGLIIKNKDYTPHLTISLFLIGIILILLSFLKI